MIRNMVIFGAAGDLAGRFLLPALAKLLETKKLPEGFAVVAADVTSWDDAAFQRHAEARLRAQDRDVASQSTAEFLRSLRYRKVDFGDRTSIAQAMSACRFPGEPVAAYLALPTRVFPAAVRALGEVGLPRDSRIVLEKPFGEDLQGATELNGLLASVVPGARQGAVFRVDHALGMATVRNVLAMRSANPMLEAIWNGTHVEQVEILWEETLALEGRASYYDRAGALKDVMQNHMMQVLCQIAMELPDVSGGEGLHEGRCALLRAVRMPRGADATALTRRARYTAGRLGDGQPVPAYVDEDGVDQSRRTETFAEVLLEVGTERWRGTCFRLRAGKALARRRKEVILHFRHRKHRPALAGNASPVSRLRIGIDGPLDIRLDLIGAAAGPPPREAQLTLTGAPPPAELPTYGYVLLDVLQGGSDLSVDGREAEEAWGIVMPILDSWAKGEVPMLEYAAGSSGPLPLSADGLCFGENA